MIIGRISFVLAGRFALASRAAVTGAFLRLLLGGLFFHGLLLNGLLFRGFFLGGGLEGGAAVLPGQAIAAGL